MGITDVSGIKVGNAQNLLGLTGVTVVLCEDGATASVQVLGGSPGTRETDLLRGSCTVDTVHAVFLAGGSAFGLNAAEGVVRYLEERKIGFDAGLARIPIVPGAIIFDLGVGNAMSRPTPDMAYRACVEASSEVPKSGNVGAGAGATVGKSAGPAHLMKSGLGNSSVTTRSGYTVGAIVVVNALGDIYDPATGKVVAGAYDRKGRRFLAEAAPSPDRASAGRPAYAPGPSAPTTLDASASLRLGENTTIGVVATDCALSKVECERVALMAMGGLAQAIRPSFTPFDGDTLFVLSTGKNAVQPVGPVSSAASGDRLAAPDSRTAWTSNGIRAQLVAEIGAAAQQAVVQAILDAVRSASGIPGIPSAKDL